MVHGRYRELAAKVDAFFARVAARHGAEMSCATGCSDCCQPGLTVTGVEAEAIAALLDAMPPATRARIAGRATSPTDRCAALDEHGRCAIYDARPLVCRSHGVPVRIAAPGHLPVVDACPKNFTARGPAAVDADCVLDQTTLSTVLHALDAAHASATGRPAGERIALTQILTGAPTAAATAPPRPPARRR